MKTDFDSRARNAEAVSEETETDTKETEQGSDLYSDPKIRKCLMCGKSFPSAWVGERICRKCKSSVAWRRG